MTAADTPDATQADDGRGVDGVGRLRAAAELLRVRVEAKRAHDGDYPMRWMAGIDGPNAQSDFHGMWTPPVALALADWLDHEARVREQSDEQQVYFPFARAKQSDAVANAILGDPS